MNKPKQPAAKGTKKGSKSKRKRPPLPGKLHVWDSLSREVYKMLRGMR